MSASLFSTRWYRVAELRPRLRPQVRVQRRRWRDQLWYQLSDDATGRQHRINQSAYRLIGRCDGQRTVQQVWDTLLDMHGDEAPSQDEAVDLLLALHENELIQFDRSQDAEALFQRQTDQTERRHRARLHPLALRLPLGDPNRLLARLDWLGRAVFRGSTFWLWLVIVLTAALSAASNGQALLAYGSSRLSSPMFLGLLWCVYPVLKLLHELGHGLAVRRWGGQVHEAGISLLVLVPAPYVDASSASSFLGRWQRALVSAAGIMVELTLAALGLALWLQLQDGLLRDIAFALILIGSLSTLLINGNPLLRFDGYHVLCDALDLPNLAPRSTHYWTHLLRSRLLRLPSVQPQTGKGEAKWLLLYAPLSFAYRFVVSLAILLWLSGVWLPLALVAGIYFLLSMVLRPLWHWTRQTLDTAAPGAQLTRARVRLALLVLLPGLLVFALPVPHNTMVTGVIWLPDQAHLRPETDGFIADLPVRDGQPVAAGDLVIRLINPELVAERERLLSRLAGLQTDRYRLLLNDPVGAQNQAELIARTEAELDRAEKRISALEVRTPTAGRLVMPHQVDLPGSFVRHGHPLGYVLPDQVSMVRAAVPEQDIHLIQTQTVGVSVRLVEAPGRDLSATINTETPAATRDLPSAALGDRAGGVLLTDPSDPKGTRLVSPVFLLDLGVGTPLPPRIGERVWIRFEHRYTPLAWQLHLRLSQQFIKLRQPAL